MDKKTYIAPKARTYDWDVENVFCASIADMTVLDPLDGDELLD